MVGRGEYLSSSAYQVFFLGRTTMLGAKEVWRASTPAKSEVLLLVGPAWAAMDDETIDHMFTSYVFTREV
jgi:hypothetical protein